MILKTLSCLLLISLQGLVVFCQPTLQDKVMGAFDQLPFPPGNNYNEEGNIIREALFNYDEPIKELYHQSTHLFVGTEEGKLYLRKPDQEKKIMLAEPKEGWKWDVEGALWSPGGEKILIKQVLDQEVPRILLQKDSLTFYEKTYSRAGQPIPKHQYFIVDTESGKSLVIEHDLSFPYVHSISWSKDSKMVFLLRANRLLKQVDLLQVEVASCEVNVIFTETSKTYLVGLELLQGFDQKFKSKHQIVIQDTTFTWQSERNGYNQLYLYHLDGRLIRPLTSMDKNGIVYDVSGVYDGFIYFIASGTLDQVYERHLFRASLSEPLVEKIIEGPIVYLTGKSRNWDTLWIDRVEPFKVKGERYTATGEYIDQFGEADISFTMQEGYQPEYLWVTLSDETTRVPVFLLKPKDFDPTKKYPVVEYIYGGSHTIMIPRTPFGPQWQLQELANSGHLIIITDTRGTPGQGKKYQDYMYGRMGQVEIADHAYVLKSLAQKREYIDLDRVGITGGSWGGYYSLRALIERPDIYKAGFITSPSVDLSSMRVSVEAFMGCLPNDCPEAYKKGDVTNQLSDFSAPLMILHGTRDDDVPVEESRKLVEKLDALGKENIELIELPEHNHFIDESELYMPSIISFFKKHLK